MLVEHEVDPDVPEDIEYLRYFKAPLFEDGVVEAQGTDLVIFEIEVPKVVEGPRMWL